MFRVGLTFDRRETEREYMQWAILRYLRRIDSEFLCIFAGLSLAASVRFAIYPMAWHHAPIMALCTAYIAWSAAAWRKTSVQELTLHRTNRVLGMRAFILFVYWVLELRAPPIPTTSLPAAFLSGGVVQSLFLGWCLRLNFQHHVPCQVASTFVFLVTSAKRRCFHLMETSGPESAWFVARKLDYWAKSVMFTVYGRCSIEPMICPCLHVLVWLHVFGISIVGSYFLWKVERRSRRMFIRTLSEQRRRDEGLVAGFEDALWTKLMVALLFVFAFAVVWELSYFLVGAMDSLGG